MSLTGRPLLIVLVALAIGTPIAGVRLWSVYGGRGRTLFRVGLFVTAQLAALAVAAVAANDYGQFYPSWSDLARVARGDVGDHAGVVVRSFGGGAGRYGTQVAASASEPRVRWGPPAPVGPRPGDRASAERGTTPAARGPGDRTVGALRPYGPLIRRSPHSADNAVVAPAAARARSAAERPAPVDPPVPPGSQLGLDTGPGDLSGEDAHRIVEGLKPTSPPDTWDRDGAVVHLPVPGDGGRAPGMVLAYLPPSYFSGEPGAAHLPVVEMLTGYPGTPTAYTGGLHVVKDLQADLAAGVVSPMVLVMTRPMEPYPRDTECMDIPNGPSNMHYLSRVVPDATAQLLQLSVPALGVIGYSSGGYCALKLAMTFPEIYVGAGSMSGYYAAEPGPTSGDLFGHDPRVRDEADLNWRLDHLPAPDTAVVLATARDEGGPDGIRPAQNFLRRVHAPMTAEEIVRPHGGHNFTTWSAELPDMLHWMDHRLKVTEHDHSQSPAPARSGDRPPVAAAEPAAERERSTPTAGPVDPRS